jgi:2,3-bisphosphoglycerate-independent phosphoglycerate mutase
MEACIVTDRLLDILRDNPYGLIVVNFANCDMVGHTGVFESARRAVEVVDECVGKVVERLLELDGHVLITADHGNAEEMIDPEPGWSKPAIPPIRWSAFTRPGQQGEKLAERGKLSDIAPTALKLLGLSVPAEMTAVPLILV